MKRFKTLEEKREYNAKYARKSYQRRKEDPERHAAHLAKRRAYDKKRYREIMDEIKSTDPTEYELE